ncbi:TetR/AcrR family transcriptional regulator [Oryzifoliimicrobium ureilyticus]|uniref:TetR/AcrR family transcriptional regulator n=1 Tax=Oryzifoliimicrobium ureilyticus TaxID=3113724 RepID=UPI0030766690
MAKPQKKITRAEQKAMRPRQILDAAFEAFSNNGFLATRVEDIAAKVGVTKGTVYVYYPTKEDLFEAVMQDISVSFVSLIPEIDKLTGTCSEKLGSLIQLLYDRVIDDQHASQLFRFLVSEGPRFPDMADRHHKMFVQPMVDRLQAIIDQGVASGEFRAGPSTKMAEVVGGPAMMMCFWRTVFQGRQHLDIKEFSQAHVDLVIHSLTSHRDAT